MMKNNKKSWCVPHCDHRLREHIMPSQNGPHSDEERLGRSGRRVEGFGSFLFFLFSFFFFLTY